MRAIVLGCGLVGGLIARDLVKDKDFQVTAADIDEKKLDELTNEPDIRGIKVDLSSSEDIRKIVADQDIVIGAVLGFLRFNMLRSVIEAGKNIVDISFMAEDTLSLNALKVELIYPKKYETRIEAQRDIFEYIEVFYNRERLHSFLGYNSPEEYEKMTMVT